MTQFIIKKNLQCASHLLITDPITIKDHHLHISYFTMTFICIKQQIT